MISYSIYGNFWRADVVKTYLEPFKKTLRRIPSIYPGRVKPHRFLQCNRDRSKSKVGRHIRDDVALVPLLDGIVDALMWGDSDSHIIAREADAARAWLASDSVFDIMRDHPSHCRFIVGYSSICLLRF